MPSTSTTNIQESAVGIAVYGDHNTNNIGTIIVNYIKPEIRIFVIIILSIIMCLIAIQVINKNQDGNSQFTRPVGGTQAEIYEDEFNMPRLIDTFHGRGEEFKKLDELFFSDNKPKIVVHGLPGYGKTELCKQYAQKCLDEKKVERIFWIKAENADELKNLSRTLNMIYKKYENVQCMFVFDNALNRRSICNYEPSNKHKMLITSHVADWGPGVAPLPIKPLSPEPARRIFKTILEDNYKDEDSDLYDDLAQAVDYVPLGIQIVGGYVRQRMKRLGKSFLLEQCVEEFKESRQDIIKKPLSKDIANSYEFSIYGALTVSLNKIHEDEEEDKELAVIVLSACAFLSPESIWINKLLQIPTIRELIGNTNGKTKLKSAVGLLVNFSFVSYADRNEDEIKIHRLVQLFLRQHLYSSSLEDEKCCRTAVYSMLCFHDYYDIDSVLRVGDASIVQECVGFLKKIFQSPNCTTNIIYEYNLFYYAAQWNELEILEILLQHANLNKTNYNGYKVLFHVAATWNTKAVEWLIKHDLFVNHRYVINFTLVELLLLKKYGHPHRIVSTLTVLFEHDTSIYNVFDINLSSEIQFWLLSTAARMNNVELLSSLLNKGFDVKSTWRNYTVLYAAVAGGNVESLKLLINHGADVNALNDDDEILSFQIVKYRSTDKQKLREILDLLNFNDHVDRTNSIGQSLLHWAAISRHVALMSVLVETYKCKVNEQDVQGYTPLQYFIFFLDLNFNKEEVIRIVCVLIQHGASLTIRNKQHQTPLELLKGQSSSLAIEYLVPLLTSTPDTKHRCTVLS